MTKVFYEAFGDEKKKFFIDLKKTTLQTRGELARHWSRSNFIVMASINGTILVPRSNTSIEPK